MCRLTTPNGSTAPESFRSMSLAYVQHALDANVAELDVFLFPVELENGVNSRVVCLQ